MSSEEVLQLKDLIKDLYYQIELLKKPASAHTSVFDTDSNQDLDPEPEPEFVPVIAGPEPKVNPPEPFFGDRTKTRNFLMQLEIVFSTQPSRYSTDRIKVMYLGSFLRGPAASWFAPYVERNPPILNNYRTFMILFRNTFDHPDLMADASRKLRNLQQGNQPVSILATEFRRIAVDVDWTESALMDAFYNALLDRVKDRLSEMDRPETLEKFIIMAIRIDDRQFQRLQEKKALTTPVNPRNQLPRITQKTSGLETKDISSENNGSTSRTLDSTFRKPLTQDQKNYRRTNNLCLYCGNGGHRLAQCPLKPISKNGPGEDSGHN